MKLTIGQQHYVALLYQILSISVNKCLGSICRNSYTPLRKVWLSLSGFLRNLRYLDAFYKELIYLLTPWLYGPLRTLTSLITDAHSFTSTAFCHHLLTFISRRSFSTSPSHHILGLSRLLLPSDLLSNIFLTVLPWSILTTCPVHSSLCCLTSATMYSSLYSSLRSWSVLILHIPALPPFYVPLLIFPSPLFISISAIAHVSLSNTTTGFTTVFIS
jgi:hypothetical protein